MEEERSIELFVSAEESSILEKIALGEAPFSQRAQAILAADAGSNLEQAAGVSGLRATQVRFWLGRFRHSRLTIFPETMVEKIEDLLRSESGGEKMEEDKKKKSAKKSKKSEPEVKKKDTQKKNKNSEKKSKKSAKKKADLTKGKKGKKKDKASKDKKTSKAKKSKKQKKKK